MHILRVKPPCSETVYLLRDCSNIKWSVTPFLMITCFSVLKTTVGKTNYIFNNIQKDFLSNAAKIHYGLISYLGPQRITVFALEMYDNDYQVNCQLKQPSLIQITRAIVWLSNVVCFSYRVTQVLSTIQVFSTISFQCTLICLLFIYQVNLNEAMCSQGSQCISFPLLLLIA